MVSPMFSTLLQPLSYGPGAPSVANGADPLVAKRAMLPGLAATLRG